MEQQTQASTGNVYEDAVRRLQLAQQHQRDAFTAKKQAVELEEAAAAQVRACWRALDALLDPPIGTHPEVAVVDAVREAATKTRAEVAEGWERADELEARADR